MHDSLPVLISSAAAVIAQGMSDEDLALLSAVLVQLGDSLAVIAAHRAGIEAQGQE